MASPQATFILSQQPEPTEFSCPACLNYNRLLPLEPQQRCTACGDFHDTRVLLADGWAL
jgi:hypothetical protein